MTTRIVLGGTAALSARATAVQAANRASLEQRQRDSATTAKVVAAAPPPPRVGGLLDLPSRLIFRPRRLSATDGVALAWVFEHPITPPSTVKFTIECATRATGIEAFLNVSDGAGGATNWDVTALPVGAGTLILLITNAGQSDDSYVPNWLTVVVGTDTVREIPTPAALKSAFLASPYLPILPGFLKPEYPFTLGSRTIDITTFCFSLPGTDPEYIPDDFPLYVGRYTASTPAWYTLLQTTTVNAPLFDEPDAGSYAWCKRNFLLTAPTPSYALTLCVSDGSCPIGQFDIDKLPEVPPNGDYWDTTAPDGYPASAFVASGVPPITFNNSKPAPDAGTSDEGTLDYGFIFTWDWGNSAYCRAQLLALGFSPADLTP